MTLSQTVATLAQHGGRLIVDEDGELTADFPESFEPSADLIESLRAHKQTLAEAFVPADTEREAIQWADTAAADAALQAAVRDWGTPQIEPMSEDEELAKRDPILRDAGDWLWHMATTYEGGSVHGEDGRFWHVRETVARLLDDNWKLDWLSEIWLFYNAMRKDRDVLSIAEARRINDRQVLSEAEKDELKGIFREFNDAAERSDQSAADIAWEKLTQFNLARGRATRTNPPTLPQSSATTGAKPHEAVN